LVTVRTVTPKASASFSALISRTARNTRSRAPTMAVNPIADFHDEYSRVHCGHAHTPLGKCDIELSMLSREQGHLG
jgi:hypothetical protein